MTRDALRRVSGAALLLLAIFTMLAAATPTVARAWQEATPAATYSCETMPPAATPPGMDHGDMGEMEAGTPMAGMDMDVEFDQLYIDMMIPHHASIVAMAQAALPRLSDARLREIAQAIIATQSAEIEELRGYREQFYGSAEPMPMDERAMGLMTQAMPGMGPMEQMTLQMDPAAQVTAFCAADDPDLAFIDQTTPHHEMAITASEAALTRATHQEIKNFAQRVIDAQQREIDELTAIRGELTGMATPAG